MATSSQVVTSMKVIRYISLWLFFVFFSAQNIFAETPSAQDDSQTVAKVANMGTSAVGEVGNDTPLPDLFTGAFTYRIPIDVPTGRNGISPDLALSYRNNNGNSWVGFGWELELGAIERSTHDGVNYNGDNFVLRRAGSTFDLVQFGSGNEYRAKIENEFLRIQKQSDGTGGSGTYWIVTNKSGIRYFYGQKPATRQDYTDPNNATTYEFKWCLDKVEDPYGNFMTLNYFKDQGQIYPDQINYTENSNGSLVSSNYVKFYLESNPVASELYATHFKVKTAYRLKTISIVGNGNKVRAYKAEYAGGDTIPPMARLASLQEFGSDFQLSGDGSGTVTGGSSLPKISFDYSTVPIGFKSKIIHTFVTTFTEQNSYKFGGDFDGDGAVDFLEINYTGRLYVELSNKSGFNTRADWGAIDLSKGAHYAWYHLLLADFNADGKSDNLFIGSSGNLSVSLSNGAGFDSSQSIVTLGNDDNSRYTIADIKGDGKKAVLFIGTNGVQKFTFYNETTVCSGQSCTIIGNGAPERYRYADFNGDGKTDVLFIGSDGALQVALSNGTNFDPPQPWGSLGTGADSSRYILGDFNGDGLTELLYVDSNHDISVALSSGKSFTTSVKWVNYGDGNPANYRSFDFNGDGKSDLLVIYDSKQQYVGLSTGTSFISPTYWGVLGDGVRPDMQLMNKYFDISGDGKIDVYSHNIVAFSPVPHEALLSQDGKANLLTGIANGIGGYTQIEYAQFKDYFSNKTIGPLYTVKSVKTCDYLCNNPNLTGNSSITNFSYANGFFSKKEFRGFNYAKVTGPAGPSGEQSITETWFHQGNTSTIIQENSSTEDLRALANVDIGYMKGKPYRTKIKNQNQSLLSETTIQYAADDVAPFFNPPYETVTNISDNGSTKQTTTVTVFDPVYGNLLRKVESGDDADSRTTIINYMPNDQKWIVGFPSSVSIYKGAYISDSEAAISDSKVKSTAYYYDVATDCNTQSSSQTPDKGKVTRVVYWLKDGTSPESLMAYDDYGNLRCIRDSKSVSSNVIPPSKTSIDYDSTYTFPVTVTNPLQQTITTKYYGVGSEAADLGLYGQVKSVTDDPNLAVTSYVYDKLGRKTLETLPDLVTASWDYSGYPQHIKATDSAGMWVDSYFDGLGRTWREERKGAENKTIVTDTSFDVRGAIRQKSLPYFKGAASSPGVIFSHDTLGRIIRADNPDNTFTLACYIPGVQVNIDANGHRKRQTMDFFGRLVKVEEYTGYNTTCTTEVGSPYATTTYEYDVLGNLRFVTDAKNQTVKNYQTEMRYDTLGRKTWMKDPDMGEWHYEEYDSNGNLTLQSDAYTPPRKTRFGYDALNRLRTKDYGNDGVIDVTYKYDETPNTNGIGRLTSMTDGSGITRYNYDKNGRITTTAKTVDGTVDGYSTTIGYDKGRLTSITYPQNSETVTYGYDADSLTTVGSYATFADFTALGQPKKVTYGNGVITDFAYIPTNNRLLSIVTNSPNPDPTLKNLISLNYDYYNNGNIWKITDNLNTVIPHNFVSESFTPDPVRPHAIGLTGSGRSFHYDGNGNMESDGKRSVAYNFENMPTSVTSGSSVVNYIYDGNGQRVKKSSGGLTRIYIDKLYECPSNGLCGRYIFAGDTLLAVNDTQSIASPSIRYYHGDHLGSTKAVTDGAGNKIEAIDYYPFGENRADTGSVNVNHKYTSQELDYEVGLYNYNARLYDPEVGRFITADSIVPDPTDPQSFNRYAYVQNNPLNRIDPSGNVDFEFGGFNLCLFGCGGGGSGGGGNSSSGADQTMNFYQSASAYEYNSNSSNAWSNNSTIGPGYSSGGGATTGVSSLGFGTSSDPMYSGGTFVRVSLYSGAARLGHIGFGINTDSTEGFYPISNTIEMFTGIPGYIKTDSLAERSLIQTILIPINRDQAAKVGQFINFMKDNRAQYTLFNQNCVDFARRALNIGGLMAPLEITPKQFMQKLNSMYNNPYPQKSMNTMKIHY